jgi:hypothetical protein
MIVRYYVIIKDKFKIKYTKYIGSKSASKLNQVKEYKRVRQRLYYKAASFAILTLMSVLLSFRPLILYKILQISAPLLLRKVILSNQYFNPSN